MFVGPIVIFCLFLLTCYLFSNKCSFCKKVVNFIDVIIGPDFVKQEDLKVEQTITTDKSNKEEVKAVGAKNPIKKEVKQAVKKIAKKAKKSEVKKESKDAQKKKGYKKWLIFKNFVHYKKAKSISANANVLRAKMAIARNVIAKTASVKVASAESKFMPFKSIQQMKACWASKGFGGNVDCAEWMKKTNYKNLPKKVENSLPFKEEKQDKKVSIRKFSENTNKEEFVWHRDNEDRIVTATHETDWKFQRDNNLPEPILGEIKIKAGEWHRIIKGTGDLEVKIIKS